MPTTNVVFPIGIEMIEDFLRTKNKLECPVSVWACGMDEIGESMLVAVEVDDCDLEKLGIDEFALCEEGDFVQ